MAAERRPGKADHLCVEPVEEEEGGCERKHRELIAAELLALDHLGNVDRRRHRHPRPAQLTDIARLP